MALLEGIRFIFSRLSLSYLLDCVVLLAFAIGGGVLSFVSPTRRAFSITDDTISFPLLPDTVSIETAFLAAVVAPAAIVVGVCLVCITRPSSDKSSNSKAVVWRRKLWELFTGLLGLALSVILAFFFTQAMKNLFGKPRPDLLQRCNPDLSQLQYTTLGGFTSEALEGTSILVDWRICKTRNGTAAERSSLDDGFRSFPSGHSSIAFAGLTYLSLFLAAKFSVTIPALPLAERTALQKGRRDPSAPDRPTVPSQNTEAVGERVETQPRSQSAAPPIYLLVIVLIPVGAAIYISSTRFADYHHHGFDVLTSSILGLVCAWVAFRWYHMPIRRGAGWAWGPRSESRAFGIRIGVGNYHISKADREREEHGTVGDAENPLRSERRGTDGTELQDLGGLVNRADTYNTAHSGETEISHRPILARP